MIDYQEELIKIGKNATKSFHQFNSFTTEQKNNCLKEMATLIRKNSAIIKEANQKDILAGKQNNLTSSLLDRLKLTDERIEGMAKAVDELIELQDPLKHIDDQWTQDDGIDITKKRTPIGVICIIYESRPNVTVDAATLCLKSGNAVILRGGKEAIETNQVLVKILREAGQKSGMPNELIQFIPWTDRKAVKILLTLDKYINLIIPRGGEGLIRAVVENSTIPIIKHDKGLCHIYLDETADIIMAKDIIINAKCQRPGVCNALETLLVNKKQLSKFVSEVAPKLKELNVELRGDNTYCSYDNEAKLATQEDWSTEYLELILSIKVVNNVDEAIEHINKYGSGHSDAIISNDKNNQEKFTLLVDSATVYINASTRFTDGGAFGFGAEIGISTDRLHARGPMALKELTTYKYILRGNGQIRK